MREGTGQRVWPGPGLASAVRASVADEKECEAAPYLLDPQVLVRPSWGLQQGCPL